MDWARSRDTGRSCHLPVPVGQRINGLVGVEPAGVGNCPNHAGAQRFGLWADFGFRIRERDSIGGDPSDRNDSWAQVLEKRGELFPASSQFR